MKNDRQVTFRRVRGRIIPIRLKDVVKDRNVQKGVGAGILGASAAVGAGVGAAHLVRKAAESRIMGNTVWQASLPDAGSTFRVKSLIRRAAELRMNSMRLRGLRKPVLAAGGVAAASLLGLGLAHVLKSKTFKKRFDDDRKAQMQTGIAAAAPLLTSFAYYKTLGLGLDDAKRYATAAIKGTTHLLKKIPIKTKFGPLIFR